MAKKDVSSIVSGMGLATSIITSLIEKAKRRGLSDDDIHRLATPEGEMLLDRFVEMMAELHASVEPALRFDKRTEGWKLLLHTPRRITSIANLELVSFLKDGESSIGGKEMVPRAREFNANLGQEDAEWLFEHQTEIPKEFREYYLVFPGSVWQYTYVNCHVPYLKWYDGEWCLDWHWLENVWHSRLRLLRLRK